MLFNSLQFLIFFPLVTLLYFAVPHRYRWALLLTASCVFYMAFIPIYILILVVTILIDYWAGMYIEARSGRPRRVGLIVSIVSTCVTLFFFKYYDFFATNLSALGRLSGAGWTVPTLGLILPIGLSFHTFQSLSYVIEVYRGRQRAQRHLGIYALYVMFYPQLVAGPIERPQNLLHQFLEPHAFRYAQVRDGLRLMLWGLFKKVVVADRLSIYVSAVYGNLSHHGGRTLILATVMFAFQIYCDFSGYSDIALGAARVMGFTLMRNFDRPYFAKSVGEFWRRWHISLSTWFRDYVYVPLGGSRASWQRWCFNIMATFLISGLWHGANWTYLVWGGLNGLYQVGGRSTASLRLRIHERLGLTAWPRLRNVWCAGVTFALTCLAWVFFRAPSMHEALSALSRLGDLRAPLFTADAKELTYGVAGIALVLAMDYWTRGRSFEAALSEQPVAVRWSVYLGLIIAILAAGVFNASQFIYFQF